ncbi:hypothetical protein [Streptomyces sp. NPDC003036]
MTGRSRHGAPHGNDPGIPSDPRTLLPPAEPAQTAAPAELTRWSRATPTA